MIKPYTKVRILDKRCDEIRNIVFFTRQDAIDFIREYANRITDVIMLLKTYDIKENF